MVNSLTELSPRTSWDVVWGVAASRLRMMSRYRGWFLLDIMIPMGYPPGFPELLPIGQELVIVTAFGLLMPALGYVLYKAAERKVRIDGSLAEF